MVEEKRLKTLTKTGAGIEAKNSLAIKVSDHLSIFYYYMYNTKNNSLVVPLLVPFSEMPEAFPVAE